LSLITYQNLATYSFQERKGDNIWMIERIRKISVLEMDGQIIWLCIVDIVIDNYIWWSVWENRGVGRGTFGDQP
jgi:hypothetical protein